MSEPSLVYEEFVVLQLMREDIAATPGGQAAWAKDHGLSGSFVSEVLRGTRGVSDRLARQLGHYKMTFYVPLPVARVPLPAETEPEGPVVSEFLDAHIESEV
jgi:hypothetical protein